jgi:hypothetical protein
VNYSTPNTPAELIALHENSKFDVENPEALAELIQELQEEYDPSPLQGLRAAQQLLEQLHYFHFQTVENAEESGLTEYQRQMWIDDTALIKQAINALRQVNT